MSVAAQQVTGLILCGGMSRRMGTDKALLRSGQQSLIQRGLAVLDEVCGVALLATGVDERYAELGRRVVLDSFVGAGPLAGLLAGLEAMETEWLVALACDMPEVRPQHLSQLLEQAQREELDACLLASADFVEPLCAVYRASCRAAVREALSAGKRRMVSFWSGSDPASLKVGRLPVDAFHSEERLDPSFNVNTPADWAVFQGESRGGADR